ncbi:MAG: hypothetical protein E7031_05830 [Akkermansiaceae bacterium]|nr:hypothetical protein [Akkermansiaceae bacterium]
MKKICKIALTMLLCSLSTPVWADDVTANLMVYKARAQYDANDFEAQERAFELFYDAYSEADSYDLRKQISDELCIIYQNYKQFVNNHMPPYLDDYTSSKASFYQKLAKYNDARGMRLYAIHLIMTKNDAEGLDLMVRAANGGDAAAAFYMARICKRGLLGCTANADTAYKWLKLSAENGFAPAWEKLSAIHWDGDSNWNANWNQNYAITCLDKAIELYSAFTLWNASKNEQLTIYIKSLKHIKSHMESFVGYATGSIIADFYPTFLALRLSFYSENETGLRYRAYYIGEAMEEYGRSYHIDATQHLDLSLIPIRLCSIEDYSGFAIPKYTDGGVHFQINVDAEDLPYITDERSRWLREIKLNKIIAHEMAHCYFFSRYSYISDKKILEGQATNAEYAFANYTYFVGGLTAENFANMITTEYAGYFRWYRSHCLKADGGTNWEVIDSYERTASPYGQGGSNRTIVAGPDGVFETPLFFD